MKQRKKGCMEMLSDAYEDARRESKKRHCLDCGRLTVSRSQVCRECTAKRHGSSPIERHHVLGKLNDPATVTLPANDHEELSAMQERWPDLLRNGDGPELSLARFLRAIGDFFRWASEKARNYSDELLSWYRAGGRFGERWVWNERY